MWLFTQYGFYSAVCARGKGGRPNPKQVMVRSRSRDHLSNLVYRFSHDGPQEILCDPEADYPYRIIIPKTLWVAWMRQMANEVDYGNFKGRCEAAYGKGSGYVALLHRLWFAVAGAYRGERPPEIDPSNPPAPF